MNGLLERQGRVTQQWVQGDPMNDDNLWRTTLPRVWRQGVTLVRDPLRLSRVRWFFLAGVLGLGSFLMGAGFTLKGDSILLATGPYAIYGHIPGGLHTHGVALLIMGLCMIVGISGTLFGHPEPQRYLRTVMKVSAVYYTWSWTLIVFAPAVNGGEFSYIGVVVWAMIASLPYILATSLPPTLSPRDEVDLLQTLIDYDIPPHQAADIVENFYHDGTADGGLDATA